MIIHIERILHGCVEIRDIFTCSSESSPGVSLVFINIIKQFQHYYCIEDVT